MKFIPELRSLKYNNDNIEIALLSRSYIDPFAIARDQVVFPRSRPARAALLEPSGRSRRPGQLLRKVERFGRKMFDAVYDTSKR